MSPGLFFYLVISVVIGIFIVIISFIEDKFLVDIFKDFEDFKRNLRVKHLIIILILLPVSLVVTICIALKYIFESKFVCNVLNRNIFNCSDESPQEVKEDIINKYNEQSIPLSKYPKGFFNYLEEDE